MSILRGGQGHRRPQRDVSIAKLHPDPLNPRLPQQYQGKGEDDLIEALYKFFHLNELAISMYEHGYFDAEPLVVIPQSLPEAFQGKAYHELNTNLDYKLFIENQETEFTVVEGNRRLSTAKLLLNGTKKTFPTLGDDKSWVAEDISTLPVIIYPDREQVIAYIGARHIIGTKKWDAYAKARYVASLREVHGLKMDEIQRTVGDTGNSIRKIYACYRTIELIETEYEQIDTTEAKDNFSFLILATGQGAIKDFIGLPKKWSDIDFDGSIIPDEKKDNFKKLFLWLFGDGKDQRKIIKESRDITNFLTEILRDSYATEYLLKSGELLASFERSGGEEKLLAKYLTNANRNLDDSLALLTRHKDSKYLDELRQLEKTLESAINLIENV